MKPQSLEMITKLVGFDTVSRNSNLELIHYVRDYLAGHGVQSQLIANREGTKANLFATVGPQVEGGIVLSRALKEPNSLAEQILVLRSLIKLLFQPQAGAVTTFRQ